MLLCLVIILSLMPTTIFASNYIREVCILNVREPVVGAKWEYQWDKELMVDESSPYSVFQEPEWYDETEGRFLESNDTFEEGHSYTVSVWVEAKNGYEFNATATSYNMNGQINGKEAKLSKAFEYQRWAMVVVSYTFPELVEGKKIKAVDVKDFTEPKIGRQSKARANYLKYSEGVEGYKAYWYADDNFDTPFTGVFAENKSYSFELVIEAAEGYSFATDQNGKSDVLVFFNSVPADKINFDGVGRLVARINYGNLGKAPEKIDGVISFKIKALVAGETPSYEAEDQREDGLYYIDKSNPNSTKNGITWMDVEDNDRKLRETDTFEEGKIYYVAIRVKPKEGYVFDTDENGDLMISGAINGYTAIVGGNDEEAFVGLSFKRLESTDKRTVISEIEATSDYPSICYMYGDYYTPQFTITKGSPATINFTDWEVKYGNKDWETFASNKNFSGGLARISAQIRIDGEADQKYVISKDTKVKVNGEEWTVSGVRVEDGYSYGWIRSPEIVPVPIEEAPTFTVTFDSKGGSKVATVTGLYYGYGVTEFDDPVRVGYKFDGWYKDEQYNEKFIFINNTNDIMDGYDRVYKNITLYAKWIEIGEEKQEKPQETEKPTEPEKPATSENPQETPMMSFVDVVKGQYYYDAVMWAANEGITGGTSANTFSPNSNCSRAQGVTFLHRMIASPEPALITLPFTDVSSSDYFYKPVKWAFGSEITGGTSATTFSPDSNCSRAQVVTFLWRTTGQPEAKSSKCNFTDVKSDSYYYKAVLWAVENGITGGTSAITFSPEDSCTRGQVVTFLYRFINGQ